MIAPPITMLAPGAPPEQRVRQQQHERQHVEARESAPVDEGRRRLSTPKAIAIISSGRVRRHSKVGSSPTVTDDGQRPAREGRGGGRLRAPRRAPGRRRAPSPATPGPAARGRPGLVPDRADQAAHSLIVRRSQPRAMRSLRRLGSGLAARAPPGPPPLGVAGDLGAPCGSGFRSAGTADGPGRRPSGPARGGCCPSSPGTRRAPGRSAAAPAPPAAPAPARRPPPPASTG